jgi:hypothetical protein
MSDRPAPEEARAFPPARPIERSAAIALAIGTLSLTATFGLRTAVFLPDYTGGGQELTALAIHGAVELVAALVAGFLVVWLRREGLAKALLVVAAILASFAKTIVLMVYVRITEPPEALLSPGTLLLCGWATLPLWISFLPVLSAIHAARRARAIDAPLGVRAAVGAWLAAVALVSLVLGPDVLVRAWALITLGAAAFALLHGSAEEQRLAQWVRGAITQGAPVYDVQEGAVPDDVPSVYEGEARTAVISATRQDSASYRHDPVRVPVAAIDPGSALAPRSFRIRVRRRAAIPLLVGALAAVLSWPFLHGDDLPPRKLAWQYNHYNLKHHTEQEIPGVSLWTVDMGAGSIAVPIDMEMGPGGRLLLGFDHDENAVVQGKDLFRRARDMQKDDLAKLANGIFYLGFCCVVTTEEPASPNDGGARAMPPSIQKGKLVFFRRKNGKLERFEVDVEPAMVAGGESAGSWR